MSDTICIIGSRIIIPSMQDDLKKTLKDLSGLKNLNFATGGCGGISAAAISFCIENNVCPRLTIWLAKRIVNARQDLMPIINKAKKCGAKIIESNCKHYLSGIICRNKEMIEAGDLCYAWRLNKSKGTTHKLAYAEQLKKLLLSTIIPAKSLLYCLPFSFNKIPFESIFICRKIQLAI